MISGATNSRRKKPNPSSEAGARWWLSGIVPTAAFEPVALAKAFRGDFLTVSYRKSRRAAVRLDIAEAKLCLCCRKHCNLLNRRVVEKPPEKIPLPAAA